MKKYYVSDISGTSGISKYSRDFYGLVLKDKGYILLDASLPLHEILTTITSKDLVHIELGIFHRKEQKLLFSMIRANYPNIIITLHDPPLLKYPLKEFNNQWLNKASKFVDVYLTKFGANKKVFERIRHIYVLSEKAEKIMQERYSLSNVSKIPHIINGEKITKAATSGNGLIYFGFIGKKKGLEYALKLHKMCLAQNPALHFYVVGKSLGSQTGYYEYLKKKYSRNVVYTGFVEEEKLADIFNKATLAVIPFRDYKFYYPFSGSILTALVAGKIVVTNDVNCTSELIRHGETGFFLTGDLKEDSAMVLELLNNSPVKQSIITNVYDILNTRYTAAAIKEKIL